MTTIILAIQTTDFSRPQFLKAVADVFNAKNSGMLYLWTHGTKVK